MAGAFDVPFQTMQGLSGLRNQRQQFDAREQQMGLQQQQADMAAQQQQAQAERQKVLQQKLQGVMNPETGQVDPQGMTSLILTDPEIAETIQKQLGLVDGAQKTQALNRATSLKQMLKTASPEQALQMFQSGGYADDPVFKGLADNLQAGDIEGAIDELGYGVAAVGGQGALDAFQGVQDAPGAPSNVREYQYWQTLSPEQQREYMRVKRATQLFKENDVTNQLDEVGGVASPVPQAGQGATTQADRQAQLTEQQATKAASTKAAENAIALSDDAFKRLEPVKTAIANYDEAIDLVEKRGANTGFLASKFPSIQQASIKLDNLQGRLGLDVIGNTTFGALSESELKFALDTALPKNLKGPELVKWLQKKKATQQKLAGYLEEAAIYLGTPGNTAASFLEDRKASGQQAQPEAAPGASPQQASAPAPARQSDGSYTGQVQRGQPPVEGAKQAPDGNWYVEQNGKFFKVEG